MSIDDIREPLCTKCYISEYLIIDSIDNYYREKCQKATNRITIHSHTVTEQIASYRFSIIYRHPR